MSTSLNRIALDLPGEEPVHVPLARPTTPDWEAIAPRFKAILDSGRLTNGSTVAELEQTLAEYIGVRHCIAVSSCTSGLMLVLRAGNLGGEVIVPSFTFAATAHAVAWNGLRPIFADCDPETLTLTPDSIEAVIGPHTTAILAAHIFGTPCDVDALGTLAERYGLELFFDAAHALGARSGGRPVGGFGRAEVFSLTPTKPLVAGEGGVIATNDDRLAERCRAGRDYGNPGDYNTRFVGLSARMSELHAAMALETIGSLDERIVHRNRTAALYRSSLADEAGIDFPAVREGDRSTYKDLTLLVRDAPPALRDTIATSLAEDGIETRTYYAPPVHRQFAYRMNGSGHAYLPVTESVCDQVLTLPLWDDMPDQVVDHVCAAIRRAIGSWEPNNDG